MANRKILSCSIDDLKEKINCFYFIVGGFLGGHDSIKIIKNDIQIKYICNGKENTFTKENLNEFIDKIFNENILKWKREYYNNNILDGTQWKLEIEFKALPKFESFGSNEFPSNWKKFITIINNFFPQIELNYYDNDFEDDEV